MDDKIKLAIIDNIVKFGEENLDAERDNSYYDGFYYGLYSAVKSVLISAELEELLLKKERSGNTVNLAVKALRKRRG